MTGPRAVDVVVGLIGDPGGRWLVNCRPPGTPLAGSWEFPGGKKEPGEAALAALKRELHEELGIQVLEAEPVAPYVREAPKVGRNDPCPCGSGKKFKQCHGRLS